MLQRVDHQKLSKLRFPKFRQALIAIKTKLKSIVSAKLVISFHSAAAHAQRYEKALKFAKAFWGSGE